MRTFVFFLIALAVLSGLWLVFKPSETPAPVEPAIRAEPRTQSFKLELVNGALVSGPAVISVAEGDRVSIEIVSDKADELHLHGYDLSLKLTPGQSGTLSFVADRSGRFDYELHHAHRDLGVVEVSPR